MSGRRLAVVVTVEHHDDPVLRRYAVPSADVRSLAAVLGDPGLGGFDVEFLQDPETWDAYLRLQALCDGRTGEDCLLLYFRGILLTGPNGGLYLATPDTVMQRPADTAVDVTRLDALLHRSQAGQVMVVLDGRTGGPVDAGAYFPAARATEARSRVVIMAAARPEPPTFAGLLADGIRGGAADRDRDGYIGIDEIFDHLRERDPSVRHWVFGSGRQPYVSKVRRPGSDQMAMIAELAAAAAGADLNQAAQARATLGRMATGNDRVAAAATAAVRRTSLRLAEAAIDFGRVLPGTQQLTVRVAVAGPPLVTTSTVTTSGEGLHARLEGDQLRVSWFPTVGRLTGTVTVDGPAGTAHLTVVGEVAEDHAGQAPSPAVAQNGPQVGSTPPRVLPPPPPQWYSGNGADQPTVGQPRLAAPVDPWPHAPTSNGPASAPPFPANLPTSSPPVSSPPISSPPASSPPASSPPAWRAPASGPPASSPPVGPEAAGMSQPAAEAAQTPHGPWSGAPNRPGTTSGSRAGGITEDRSRPSGTWWAQSPEAGQQLGPASTVHGSSWPSTLRQPDQNATAPVEPTADLDRTRPISAQPAGTSDQHTTEPTARPPAQATTPAEPTADLERTRPISAQPADLERTRPISAQPADTSDQHTTEPTARPPALRQPAQATTPTEPTADLERTRPISAQPADTPPVGTSDQHTTESAVPSRSPDGSDVAPGTQPTDIWPGSPAEPTTHAESFGPWLALPAVAAAGSAVAPRSEPSVEAPTESDDQQTDAPASASVGAPNWENVAPAWSDAASGGPSTGPDSDENDTAPADEITASGADVDTAQDADLEPAPHSAGGSPTEAVSHDADSSPAETVSHGADSGPTETASNGADSSTTETASNGADSSTAETISHGADSSTVEAALHSNDDRSGAGLAAAGGFVGGWLVTQAAASASNGQEPADHSPEPAATGASQPVYGQNDADARPSGEDATASPAGPWPGEQASGRGTFDQAQPGPGRPPQNTESTGQRPETPTPEESWPGRPSGKRSALSWEAGSAAAAAGGWPRPASANEPTESAGTTAADETTGTGAPTVPTWPPTDETAAAGAPAAPTWQPTNETTAAGASTVPTWPPTDETTVAEAPAAQTWQSGDQGTVAGTPTAPTWQPADQTTVAGTPTAPTWQSADQTTVAGTPTAPTWQSADQTTVAGTPSGVGWAGAAEPPAGLAGTPVGESGLAGTPRTWGGPAAAPGTTGWPDAPAGQGGWPGANQWPGGQQGVAGQRGVAGQQGVAGQPGTAAAGEWSTAAATGGWPGTATEQGGWQQGAGANTAWPTSPAGWPASPSWQQPPPGGSTPSTGGDPAYPRNSPPGRRRLRVAGILCLALLLAAGAYLGIRYTSGRGKTDPGAAPTVTQTQPGSQQPTQSATPDESAAPVPVSLAVPVVVDTIESVGREPEGVVVSPDNRTVYVADQGAKAVFFIDAADQKVSSLAVPNTPRFMALSSDGSRLYVSMFEDDFSANAMAVIDTAKRSVITSVKTGPRPFEPAVTQDGRVWLPIHNGARVEIYDGQSLRKLSQISVPPNPHWIDFTPDGTRAFTSDHESSRMSVIDTKTLKVLTNIAVGRSPHSIAVTPDGKTVVLTNYDVNTVETYDTKTLKLTKRYQVGKLPQAVLVSADGVHAYVVNEGSDTLSVLNLKDRKVAATIRVGDSPRVVALSPDGLRLYVTAGRDGAVTVLKAAEG
ncbi:40-residue YVTN family beta-propeller repeat-containing protein [Actinoplanes regularis]|uniref:40-residue YVTN family beta-propeller repeat-containing protein n=1 Tax=Actinoplanes regularis TaxID=52697 RepID=A0A239ERI6_9ACTN|nr:hypothetical protein [Actinoplanes regularis]SNS47169.1 40-residue YVTN family beta-propeller repeat-containing protein [Actinoplanes regularis]